MKLFKLQNAACLKVIIRFPDFLTVSHRRRNQHVPEKSNPTPKPSRACTQNQVRSHTLAALQTLANHFKLTNTWVKSLEHVLTVLQTSILAYSHLYTYIWPYRHFKHMPYTSFEARKPPCVHSPLHYTDKEQSIETMARPLTPQLSSMFLSVFIMKTLL